MSEQMYVPPRVGIGIPSSDIVYTDFAMCLAHMFGAFRSGQIVLINAKGCYVDNGRNELVRVAQEKQCTHLLQLDSDMLFPPMTLERLLSHRKDIVGCVYSRRVEPFTNLGNPKDKSIEKVSADTELMEMDMLPTGCLLVDMNVFKRIDKPYFQRPLREINGQMEPMGEDVHFCERMRVAGFRIWADVKLSMHLGHIGQAIYRVQDDTKARAEAVGQKQQREMTEKMPQVAAE